MLEVEPKAKKRRFSNFHRFSFYAVGIFSLFLAFVILFFNRVSEEDKMEYLALMKSSGESKNKSKKVENTTYTLTQKRENVRKDIKYIENGFRKQMQLNSKEAELIVDNHDHTTDMRESLKDVRCCMQEELYYKTSDGKIVEKQIDGRLLIKHANPEEPSSWVDQTKTKLTPWQTLRLLIADHAIYTHGAEMIEAEKVKIFRYLLIGHDIVDHFEGLQPLLSGVAEKVSFSVSGKELNFKATKLKAIIIPQG